MNTSKMAMIIMSQQTVMFVRHTYDHIIYDTDQYSLNVGLMETMHLQKWLYI